MTDRQPALRPELTPLPRRMLALPIDERGYPIPWFVAYVDGKPEFRAADTAKWIRATREGLCWVCGDKLGSRMTFALGPMCCITRTTSEPPSHRECAVWSAINCPFLARPHMTRRNPEEMTAMGGHTPGEFIERNPGAVGLWTTRGYEVWSPAPGERLITVGDPELVEWYAEGRPATRAEVDASIESGLPRLVEMCEGDDIELADLREAVAKIAPLLPEEGGAE